MKKILFAILMAISVSVHAELREEYAEMQCGKINAIAEVINGYGEKLVWHGRLDNGNYLTVWQNPVTKTFTAMFVGRDGLEACVIASSMGQGAPL